MGLIHNSREQAKKQEDTGGTTCHKPAEDITREIKTIISDLTFDGTIMMSSEQSGTPSPQKNKAVVVSQDDDVVVENNDHDQQKQQQQQQQKGIDINDKQILENEETNNESAKNDNNNVDSSSSKDTNTKKEIKIMKMPILSNNNHESLSSLGTKLTDNREATTTTKTTKTTTTITETPMKETSNMATVVTDEKDGTMVASHTSVTPKSSPNGKSKEVNTPNNNNKVEKLEQQSTSSHNGRIRVGICAMDKKAKSKPMVRKKIST